MKDNIKGDNRITHFDISVKQPLIDMVCSNVCYGCMLYTDEFAAYNELNRYGFMHEHVNHYQKEYGRRGDIHVNNCECRSNIYQLWISKFMGTNKYNPTGIFKNIPVYSQYQKDR
jgi:hypothetical protein